MRLIEILNTIAMLGKKIKLFGKSSCDCERVSQK
jgi:hypothetical protein